MVSKLYDGITLWPTRLLIDGGYVDVTSRLNSISYAYRFYVQDHQGNNRMVTDGSGTVLQVNHYDPYGQLLTSISSTSPVSQYKYGGKEWNPTSQSYDFGARNYLPAVPRWNSMDPLAEKYYSISPYVYCAGNPVNLVDLDGNKWLNYSVVDYLKRCVTQRLDDYKNNPSTHEASEHIANLQQSLSDIEMLESDEDNHYALIYSWNDSHHVRRGEGGIVLIEMSSDAIALHEIHHVVQSLKRGGLEFNNGFLKNAAVNKDSEYKHGVNQYKGIADMEIESYKIQFSMDGSFPNTDVKQLSGINVETVGEIVNVKGEHVYPAINRYLQYLKKNNLEIQ